MSRDGYLPPGCEYSDIPGDRPEDNDGGGLIFVDEADICEYCGKTDCECVEYNPMGDDEIL